MAGLTAARICRWKMPLYTFCACHYDLSGTHYAQSISNTTDDNTHVRKLLWQSTFFTVETGWKFLGHGLSIYIQVTFGGFCLCKKWQLGCMLLCPIKYGPHGSLLKGGGALSSPVARTSRNHLQVPPSGTWWQAFHVMPVILRPPPSGQLVMMQHIIKVHA